MTNAEVSQNVACGVSVFTAMTPAGCGWRRRSPDMETKCKLNKQLRAADKEWSSRLRVGRGVHNSSPVTQGLGTGGPL
jgi:hypothetical protein